MTQEIAKNSVKKVSKFSFEEAASRLEEIVETLSSSKVNLNSMIELYEEGNALREHCQKLLDEAKMKIEIVGKKS
jgi:exodeoxyribonuclease VII small subunit